MNVEIDAKNSHRSSHGCNEKPALRQQNETNETLTTITKTYVCDCGNEINLNWRWMILNSKNNNIDNRGTSFEMLAFYTITLTMRTSFRPYIRPHRIIVFSLSLPLSRFVKNVWKMIFYMFLLITVWYIIIQYIGFIHRNSLHWMPYILCESPARIIFSCQFVYKYCFFY